MLMEANLIFVTFLKPSHYMCRNDMLSVEIRHSFHVDCEQITLGRKKSSGGGGVIFLASGKYDAWLDWHSLVDH